jgi:hypothetical protein
VAYYLMAHPLSACGVRLFGRVRLRGCIRGLGRRAGLVVGRFVGVLAF